jgi:hypothetical protein
MFYWQQSSTRRASVLDRQSLGKSQNQSQDQHRDQQ